MRVWSWLGAGALLLAGCAGGYKAQAPTQASTLELATPGQILVSAAPPPLLVPESPPPQPWPGAAWQAGHWLWSGAVDQYVWVSGRWVTPPRTDVVWQPPRYVMAKKWGWVLVRGQWVRGHAYDGRGRVVWWDPQGRPHHVG